MDCRKHARELNVNGKRAIVSVIIQLYGHLRATRLEKHIAELPLYQSVAWCTAIHIKMSSNFLIDG